MKFIGKKLLIDSNSYFRLAKSLHPLLNVPFGNENYCILILRECDKEYSKNQGLQNKFSWVNQDEFIQNRKNIITYSSDTDNAICNNIRFIKAYARENFLTVSEVDIKYLATSLELDIGLITDDGDMILIAEEFNIRVLSSLQLLKLMSDCSHINIDKIKQIIEYWVYSKDTPRNFKQDCKLLFNLDY